MKRQEFLDALRARLNRLPAEELEEVVSDSADLLEEAKIPSYMYILIKLIKR